jgi:uncharacterized membrane protein YdbT with pleckstrin-like domain
MKWRDSLLRFLHVPHTPTPPPGSPPRIFRAAPNFYKLRLIRWGLTQLAAIIGVVWTIYFLSWLGSNPGIPRIVVRLIRLGELFGVIGLIFQFILGWALVYLDYDLRWYMLSDRAIRIREGITTVREKTIALANIQNISIRQGPLQRFLGIADVEVKTAGGGGESDSTHEKGFTAEPMHVAYFRGVDNAEEIRDLVSEGARRQRDTGLGDPDEAHAEHRPVDTIDAAAELLSEARALRAVVTGV